jgi:hypothetical protein
MPRRDPGATIRASDTQRKEDAMSWDNGAADLKAAIFRSFDGMTSTPGRIPDGRRASAGRLGRRS